MYEIYPYFTNDGSVGLYSQADNDIYHSTYGALTEAYEKFILPADLENFFQKKSEIKILDICFGIGYNSKSFLNFIYNAQIDTDNNSKDKYIGKLYTDNAICKKSLSNAIKNKFTIFNITNETWKNTLKINKDGLVHYCLNKRRYPEYGNGTVIDKNKEDFSVKRDVAFRSGSYLSKTFSKDALDKYAWRYGYSRLPRG